MAVLGLQRGARALRKNCKKCKLFRKRIKAQIRIIKSGHALRISYEEGIMKNCESIGISAK
jgi:hypothetical protein